MTLEEAQLWVDKYQDKPMVTDQNSTPFYPKTLRYDLNAVWGVDPSRHYALGPTCFIPIDHIKYYKLDINYYFYKQLSELK